MFNCLTRALVKVVVASIIVGTILAHFGITTDQLMKTAGFSSDRLTDFARAGVLGRCPT
jgi:hypothetical protein